MEPNVLAGLAQVALIALLIAAHRRILAGYTVPMAVLAVGMLAGWSTGRGPEVVPRRPGRPTPDLGQVSLGVTALVVLALAWVAVGALPAPV